MAGLSIELLMVPHHGATVDAEDATSVRAFLRPKGVIPTCSEHNKPVTLGSKTQQPDGLRSLDIAEETGLNHQNLRVTRKLVAEGALEDDTKATMWDLGMEKHPGEERMLEELPFVTELIKPFRGELEMPSCYCTKPL
ncbi:hypothetical protein Q9233_004948 [Columba guinea]|nr:hypothetical protein Q9233_004948 [Columba guinea]